MPDVSALRWAAATGVLCAALFLAAPAVRATNPNALWQIVHGRCVPNQERHRNPSPCAKVDLTKGAAAGYAVLKDLVGVSQFLLIPTRRITGIEDPALLAPGAVNYFAAAWRARSFAEKALGRRLPDDDWGLAVNSTLARSQNQLHIHIDCVRADVRAVLAAEREKVRRRRGVLGARLAGHRYLAMRVMGKTLTGHNPFKLAAGGIRGARADMGLRTLVVVGMTFAGGAPGFVILEDRADPAQADYAHGAGLEDHSCELAQ